MMLHIIKGSATGQVAKSISEHTLFKALGEHSFTNHGMVPKLSDYAGTCRLFCKSLKFFNEKCNTRHRSSCF